MKYEVPEINISKFSVENIVTESTAAQSAAAKAQAALAADTSVTMLDSNSTIDAWVAAN